MKRKILSFIATMLVAVAAYAASDVNLVPLTRISGHNQKTVTTAGTEQRLSATSILCSSIVVKALSTNTGLIYVGNSSSVASTNGFVLSASESIAMDIDNVQDVWIDSSVNAEGVSWIAIK